VQYNIDLGGQKGVGFFCSESAPVFPATGDFVYGWGKGIWRGL